MHFRKLIHIAVGIKRHSWGGAKQSLYFTMQVEIGTQAYNPIQKMLIYVLASNLMSKLP